MPAILEIELDRPRRLLIDFNAICDFERSSGISMDELIEALGNERVGVDVLRHLLWAGLQRLDHQLRKPRDRAIEQCGDWIMTAAPGKTFQERAAYVGKTCVEALLLSFPELRVKPPSETNRADPMAPARPADETVLAGRNGTSSPGSSPGVPPAAGAGTGVSSDARHTGSSASGAPASSGV